ncbi:hypothetical protein DICVIV_03585 [Dictyocaulus viviparus]|uniref:SSD domain-containing protein n=1 Tax=Dictyocaulus viviparus TaxID=29172 RepID=A0A0D8Y2B3_DICVI|nr:hypothetical protein DICVIV_03585 [Dictyocaulus viviparus]
MSLVTSLRPRNSSIGLFRPPYPICRRIEWNMHINCLERRLRKIFVYYSRIVVHYPLPFIVLPVLISTVLSTGLQRHGQTLMKETLDLYTPTNAQARIELKHLDSLFHINDSDPFYAIRRYDNRRAGYIIVTHRNEGENILNPIAVYAATHLWAAVQSLAVEDKEHRKINYPEICVKFPISPEFDRLLLHTFLNLNLTAIVLMHIDS